MSVPGLPSPNPLFHPAFPARGFGPTPSEDEPVEGAEPASGGRCSPDSHCVICSDEGTWTRVELADPEAELAVCVDDAGERSEVMTALVGEVRPGDLLLTHAGTALARRGGAAEPAPEDSA